MALKWTLLVLGMLSLATACSASFPGAADEVSSLPGVNFTIPFKQYAGYLTVSKSHGRKIFYWFVEASDVDPATAPVALWTNGGPGCSGLIGFMTENGPYSPLPDGKTLQLNPNAWNKIANIVFIEAPAGVGFSYSDTPSDYNTGDTKTAEDNFAAIQAFYVKFPQYARNDFFLTSESYGGHYIPTLATLIMKRNIDGGYPQIPLKGIAVGNPFTNNYENLYGEYMTYGGHSLLSRPTWLGIRDKCFSTPQHSASFRITEDCNAFLSAADQEVGNLDPYGLDFPVCVSEQQHRLRSFIRRARQSLLVSPNLQSAPVKYPYNPCRDSFETVYLNRPDVIKAIHANADLGRPWTECSSVVNYNASDMNVPMQPLWQQDLIKNGTFRLMVYSGDDDSVCATLGSQEWIYDLNLGYKEGGAWQPWTFERQVGGYVAKFKGMSLVTVHSAGHMVPQFRPKRAFHLFSEYLKGNWF